VGLTESELQPKRSESMTSMASVRSTLPHTLTPHHQGGGGGGGANLDLPLNGRCKS